MASDESGQSKGYSAPEIESLRPPVPASESDRTRAFADNGSDDGGGEWRPEVHAPEWLQPAHQLMSALVAKGSPFRRQTIQEVTARVVAPTTDPEVPLLFMRKNELLPDGTPLPRHPTGTVTTEGVDDSLPFREGTKPAVFSPGQFGSAPDAAGRVHNGDIRSVMGRSFEHADERPGRNAPAPDVTTEFPAVGLSFTSGASAAMPTNGMVQPKYEPLASDPDRVKRRVD